MASQIKQFRFYNYNETENTQNPNNAPQVSSWRYYCDDSSFRNFAPIHQFGIQTLPGTKVYLNQSTTPIIIGATGVYELNLEGTTGILNSLRIDPVSMKAINDIDNAYLIIDIVYGGKGEAIV